MIDGISYFTQGLCVPSGGTDAVAYFTNGLLLSGATGPTFSGRGGMDSIWETRRQRTDFARKARKEAELLQILIMMVAQIEEDS